MSRPRQLQLLDDPASTHVDPHHCEVGKRGVAAMREQLAKTRDKENQDAQNHRT